MTKKRLHEKPFEELTVGEAFQIAKTAMTFTPLRPEAKPPLTDNFRLGFYAYLISDTGRAIQAVVPPRTSRLLDTQIWLDLPEDFGLALVGFPGIMARQPPLFIPSTIFCVSGHVQVLLYNGGHESVYIRHEEPIAQGYLVPLVSVTLTLDKREIK